MRRCDSALDFYRLFIEMTAEDFMADQTLNVVCICGSLRKGSYNRMVMNALARAGAAEHEA